MIAAKPKARISPYQWDGQRTKGRVYVQLTGETILENLDNRHARPIKQYREFAKQALADLGIADTTLHWSQRAGCSCPCSPGFISDSPELERRTVVVTISAHDLI